MMTMAGRIKPSMAEKMLYPAEPGSLIGAQEVLSPSKLWDQVLNPG